MRRWWALAVMVGLSLSAAAQPAPDTLRVLLGWSSQVTLTLSAPGTLRAAGAGAVALAPGTYTLNTSGATAPSFEYRLFARSFRPDETAEMEAFAEALRALGLSPEPIVVGREWATADGSRLDNREVWLQAGVYALAEEAESRKVALAEREIFAWMRPAEVAPGSGVAGWGPAGGAATGANLPLRIESDGPYVLAGLEGALSAQYTLSGPLVLDVGQGGRLRALAVLDPEAYLRDVLPAEMPALWHEEALKAQAVAGRSDILAHWGKKHPFEGYEYTASELSRAYFGESKRHERTDAALAATAGEVLVRDGRIVAAVYSAVCGGWTENNDTVWSGPPDPALRGVSDLVDPAQARPGLDTWLTSPPAAYCSAAGERFRWEQRLSPAAMLEVVSQGHALGEVQHIAPGERGPSGRLHSLRITGSLASKTLRKDQPIRVAFGNLPSTMFDVREEQGPDGSTFVFVGGGRGHGVGLCQWGAQGRALTGQRYMEILQHYFSGAALARTAPNAEVSVP